MFQINNFPAFLYFKLYELVSYLDMLGFDTNPHWVGSWLSRCVWNAVGAVVVVNHCRLHCAEGKQNPSSCYTIGYHEKMQLIINSINSKTTEVCVVIQQQPGAGCTRFYQGNHRRSGVSDCGLIMHLTQITDCRWSTRRRHVALSVIKLKRQAFIHTCKQLRIRDDGKNQIIRFIAYEFLAFWGGDE